MREVELVKETKRQSAGREITSYGKLALPSDIAMPTVILWRNQTFVLGSIGGEFLYFEADVFDSAGCDFKPAQER